MIKQYEYFHLQYLNTRTLERTKWTTNIKNKQKKIKPLYFLLLNVDKIFDGLMLPCHGTIDYMNECTKNKVLKMITPESKKLQRSYTK